MAQNKKIKTALVSVFYKDGLDKILALLNENGVKFLSTGGTQSFIQSLGYECDAVEDLTGYPSILGGRVKTLHPKVFGGILNRRDNEGDKSQIAEYEIPEIDLVIVDLYPFEETVASGAAEDAIIEKIDIGGISLIRAAAKNFKDVVIVASKAQYEPLYERLQANGGAETTLEDRKWFAKEAFAVSSAYDSHIFNYFDKDETSALRLPVNVAKVMRYGENPHQKGYFFGDFEEMFAQLHGKEISYNNLLDIDAAVNLIGDFTETTLEDRKWFAKEAFAVSSAYDSHIFNYFDKDETSALRLPVNGAKVMRYGENPHQKGYFFGDFEEMFAQLHGKEISYNNLLDIDAAVNLIGDFTETTFAILKHNNACGLASRPTVVEAWKDALAGDPISAFGGVLITNAEVDKETAEEMNKIFFEVCIAPSYTEEALEVLKQKKNRIILVQKHNNRQAMQYRTVLNGALGQERDSHIETPEELETVTTKAVAPEQIEDLLFANKIVKHSKSNAIVFAKNKQLYASGIGQTSRVDALKQAIEKAKSFGFDLNGAVMASDAFFPFADCVELAHAAGVNVVIQPGGSVRDNETIEYCNNNDMAMVMTHVRHFKH